MQRPEQTAQIGVASYLRAAIIRPARFWFVPNGVGAFTKRVAGIYKEMGLTSGVHDLHFVWATPFPDSSGFSGPRFATIEMKDPDGGSMTLNQKAFGDDLTLMGHPWAEARTLDEVLGHLTRWGVPLRSPSEAVKYAFKHGLKIRAMPSDRIR